ncbi:MAG TPA: methionyl-tRNA formyltransferase [Solirubrobacteraceae bacterium]|nr:methionyl-tRNA formyltransferase [Solirubrobacteraceae bacterium]
MSTVFIGTTEFAAAVLERLARSDAHRPALVITRPDRPAGRGRRLSSPPVAASARSLGLELEQPQSVNDAQSRALIARALLVNPAGAAASPAGEPGAAAPVGGSSAVVVCAFGALIKEPLLTEHDILNVHPSLLPRWRGAAPVERAIMAGDERTGVSIMRLTAGLDSGPVCLDGVEQIRPEDTYGSLAARLQELGGELLVRALDQRPPFVEQSDDGVTYAEKLGPADRLLDPARPAVELERVVRALHPHIGAHVELADGTLLGVHRAALLQDDDAADASTAGSAQTAAGALGAGGGGEGARASGPSVRDGRLLLACSPGVLELLVVQPPGGRAMDASAYLRGRGLPGRR